MQSVSLYPENSTSNWSDSLVLSHAPHEKHSWINPRKGTKSRKAQINPVQDIIHDKHINNSDT